jgi:hypothetical protein
MSKNFINGINEYLQIFSWKTTESKDLYIILDKHNKNKSYSISDLIKSFIKIKGYPLITIKKDNEKYIITKKTFLFNNNKYINYDFDFPLKIKYLVNEEIINKIIIITENTILINQPILNADNMMLCIINYENFEPNLKLLNIEEIMYYFDCSFYLALSGYKNLETIFYVINNIFNLIHLQNLRKNTCLINLIIKNILFLNYIIKSSKIKNSFTDTFYNFINNFKQKIYEILRYIIDNKNKDLFLTNIMIDIFNFAIDFKDFNCENIIKLGKKIFDLYYDNNNNNFEYFPLHEVIFKIIIKYYECPENINKINLIRKTSTNIFIKNSALWSLTYSNDIDFLNSIINNIFKIVQLQDIATFINLLSKNMLIQEQIIDYIFNNIKNNPNITYANFLNIIERITGNFYNKKILTILNNFYLKENNESLYALEIEKINWNIHIIENISKK